MSVLHTLERRRGRGRSEQDDDGADIDPRIDARRREVDDARRARRRARLLAVALVVTALVGAYLVTRSALLDVDAVTVAGTTHTAPDEVRAAAGIVVGDPLTGVDVDAAQARVEALPWVQHASIDRGWDGTIAIGVTERTPVVAIAGPEAGTWLLVDAERRVLGPITVEPTELAVVAGVAAARPGEQLEPSSTAAIAVARALTTGVRSRIRLIEVTGTPAVVDLQLRPSGVVHLGPIAQLGEPGRLTEVSQSLQTVFGQVDLHCLATVDLRVADAPVLTRVSPCA